LQELEVVARGVEFSSFKEVREFTKKLDLIIHAIGGFQELSFGFSIAQAKKGRGEIPQEMNLRMT
jgi:hypothetical protein